MASLPDGLLDVSTKIFFHISSRKKKKKKKKKIYRKLGLTLIQIVSLGNAKPDFVKKKKKKKTWKK